MQIRAITQFLESLAPLSSQESYDNSGLIVGDFTTEVTQVLVALDCTEEIVEEAIERGANLIVSHHPIVFKGLKKLNGKNYVERTVIKAIQHNIAIYAIHTNLDNAFHGVNYEIAQRLQLKNLKILAPAQNVLSKLNVYVPMDFAASVEAALFEAGAGKMGVYDECSYQLSGIGGYQPLLGSNPFEGTVEKRTVTEEVKIEVLVSNHLIGKVVAAMKEAHPYEVVAYDLIALQNEHAYEGAGMIGELEAPMEALTFLAQLKQTFHCGVIRHTELTGKKIKKVAFCGGAGSFLLETAKREKADIYITGDFKYHEFFDAEGQLIIADIGHFESEQFTTNLIIDVLTKKFTNFAVLNTRVNTNPINYF